MRVLPLLLLLAALPLASAQGHQHQGGDEGLAAVLVDGPPSGRAVVGGFTHFGFALLDFEGRPIVHQDASFLVEQDGLTLFASEDTHEYDGLFSFDVTFTRPGPYRVVAQSEKVRTTVFEGVAVPRADGTQATVAFAQEPPGASNLVKGTLSILGPDGKDLPHTDAILEIREKASGRLVMRTHAHVHEAPIVFAQGLDLPGEHVLDVVAYRAFPSGRSPDLAAVVAQFPLAAGPLAAPAVPALPDKVPEPLEPLGGSAEGGGFRLQATYDPQNQVGVGHTARVAAILANASGLPVPHVDFAFTLRGPRGVVFESGSLHEYDGVFEYAFVPRVPGAYHGVVTARMDGQEISVPVHLQALPPAVATSAGVGVVTVDGLEGAKAGTPVELTFSVMAPQGPVAHSEVDVTIYHDGEAPVHQFKLHTHESGTMAATVTFPHPGDWKVRVDPLSTLPEPVSFQGPAGAGRPILFEASVGPAAEGAAEDALARQGAKKDVPAWTAAALLAAGALAALVVAAARRAR